MTYQLTAADLKHLDTHGRLGLSILTWTGAVLTGGALTFRIWSDVRGFLDRVTGLPIQAQLSLLFALLFTTMFLVARHRLKLAQKPILEDQHTVSLSPDSFEVSSSHGAHSFPWRRVKTATSDSHGIYITIAPGERLIVPGHAFSSNEDREGSSKRRSN